jgi:hypothetical protein
MTNFAKPWHPVRMVGSSRRNLSSFGRSVFRIAILLGHPHLSITDSGTPSRRRWPRDARALPP